MVKEKINCDNCQNQEICKWCSKFAKIVNNVSRITDGDLENTPISVIVVCNKFIRKTQINAKTVNLVCQRAAKYKDS